MKLDDQIHGVRLSFLLCLLKFLRLFIKWWCDVTLLTPENVKSVLVNSSAATVVEFYAAWCGHCIAFSPIYKSLLTSVSYW
uniref:Thioredoxin domain-containing protein n=1 Tax=Cynoglossus semilaevis TaxID=244447 RepID=A0A3P8W504_CYNSE